MTPPIPLHHTYDVFNSYSRWIVYMHQMDGQIIWIGHCREADLMGAPDARKNAEWTRRVLSKQVIMTSFGVFDTQTEAKAAVMKLVAEYRPICNLVHVSVSRGRRVQCVETSIIYNTATEAARLVGVSDAAMSNHLANKPHQLTVGGLTFKRVP